MRKRSGKVEDIAEIAEKAYFTGDFVAKQRVNIDFPVELLKLIDAECRRIGITRQGWVKMACDEKLRRTHEAQVKAS